MQKIISLFQRNYDGDRLVRNEIVPGAEWVIAGEGVATRKWDGTCCMVRGHRLYKRYDAKHGKKPPEGFEPAQDPDPVTGHWPGWLRVVDAPEDRWFREAVHYHGGYRDADGGYDVPLVDGTYELVGPKISNKKDEPNPENLMVHSLVHHGDHAIEDCPRDFEGIKQFVGMHDIEGVVWHHPDGRMVKIKARDFGLRRGQFV